MTDAVRSTDPVLAASTASIQAGSKSFAAAARLFDPKIRADAYNLYAWCRHCDDEIDGQVLGHGAVGLDPALAAEKLVELEAKTRAALAGEPMADPAFAAFQRVALKHRITEHLPLELLEGFRMDVEARAYDTIDDLMLYAYRVAGVVGEMMACVMGVSDPAVLQRACDLGLGFQLTNIARDVIEDAKGGRVYLPGEWLGPLANDPAAVADPANRAAVFAAAKRLIETAEPYYASARWGLKALGFRSAWAIATASGVYRQIGRKVIAAGPGGMERRAFTTGADKAALLAGGAGVAARAVTVDAVVRAPARPELWRPEVSALSLCHSPPGIHPRLPGAGRGPGGERLT